MRRAIYAVIDTNVVVSALLKPGSVPGRVLAHTMAGTLVPVLSAGIEDEYAEVLARRKFRFDADLVARPLRPRVVGRLPSARRYPRGAGPRPRLEGR